MEVRWTTSNRIKFVTLKSVNIKAGLRTPYHSAEGTILSHTTEEPERLDDLPSTQTEAFTEDDAVAPDANAIAQEQSWTIQECFSLLNGNLPIKMCKMIGY